MKVYSLMFIIIYFLASCVKLVSSFKTYEADLAFKAVGLGTFYGLPDSIKSNLLDQLNTFKNKDQLTEGEEYMVRYYELLKKHGLVDLPMIKVNFDSDSKSMTSVFLDPVEFEKIKQFNQVVLSREGVKLRLKFKGREVARNKIKASEIISFEKIEGRFLIVK